MKSGFKEVSKFLSKEISLSNTFIYEDLLKIENEHGRGQVFNIFLKRQNVFNKTLVKNCVSIYRLHQPSINLNADAIQCLARLSHLPMYIVTDGNKVVQRKKIRALGVDRLVKKVYVTHQYGIRYSKPSPYCFLRIARIENVHPKEVFYIADNPKKDFVGIKPLGFRTIRILQGMFKNEIADESRDALYTIKSLDELDQNLLKRLL